MFPRYRILLLLVGCLAVFGVSTRAAEDAGNGVWKAGTAKVEITPEQFMWMAGYAGRDKPAESKLTELWAKAIVLEDPEANRAVLVTLDLIGVSRELSSSVCKTLQERHGLERRQIALCASHTHTGPVLYRNLSPLHYLVADQEQRTLIERYTATVEKKIVQVVEQALASRKPARLSWGSGTATFAVNRRKNPEKDVVQLRAEGKLQGPNDHDVPVLAVKDASDQLMAVVFGYACHSTVLASYQWSGDYPGFAQIELEKNHPGCQAMFWAGCGADQNPLPRRTVELAMDYGRQLAVAVDAVLGGVMQPVHGRLRTSFREIDLPFTELPTRERIVQDAQSADRYVSARARMLLAGLEAGQPLCPTYPYPIQVWQIGDEIQFVTLGGEVVVDFALRLKAELQGPRTWVAGYSNDVMAYIASRRVLSEGGYEGGGAMVYYGLPTTWAPESEDLIVEEVRRQARRE